MPLCGRGRGPGGTGTSRRRRTSEARNNNISRRKRRSRWGRGGGSRDFWGRQRHSVKLRRRFVTGMFTFLLLQILRYHLHPTISRTGTRAADPDEGRACSCAAAPAAAVLTPCRAASGGRHPTPRDPSFTLVSKNSSKAHLELGLGFDGRHEDHVVVLLVTAVHVRHERARCHWEIRRPSFGWRGVAGLGCIPRRATRQVGDIVQFGLVVALEGARARANSR